MKNSKALELLLEFVRNPMVLKSYAIQKYFPEDMMEFSDGNVEVAEMMSDLGRTVDEVLEYLTEQDIPAVQLITAYLNGSNSLC